MKTRCHILFHVMLHGNQNVELPHTQSFSTCVSLDKNYSPDGWAPLFRAWAVAQGSKTFSILDTWNFRADSDTPVTGFASLDSVWLWRPKVLVAAYVDDISCSGPESVAQGFWITVLSMKEYGKSAVELYFLAVGNRPLKTAATPFLNERFSTFAIAF